MFCVRECFSVGKAGAGALARACVLCAGVLLLQGAPSDAASSVLINGKPLAQIDDKIGRAHV